MKNADDFFNPLAGKAFTELINSTNDKNSSGQIRLVLALLGLLAFVGVETVKVIFRKNFGSKSLNIAKIVLSFLAFVGIGLIAITVYAEYGTSDEEQVIGSHSSFLVTGLFYFGLGIYVLVKGLVEKAKSKRLMRVYPLFRGESTILSFLIKDGWSPSRVQTVAEPVLTLALGIFLLAYNLLLGFPVIFCAISVWVYQLFEQVVGVMSVVDNTMQQKGHNRGGNFSEVQN